MGDLARADARTLMTRYGAYGLRLHDLAQGRDSRAVDPEQERKGVSAETTFNTDLSGLEALENELWPLCEKVARRLRRDGLTGRVATLKLKTPDFRLVTRRRTLSVPTQTAKALFACGRELLAAELKGRAFRLIGIGLSDLVEASAPSDLFGDQEARARSAEQTLDQLRSRFGDGAIVSGRALKT